MISSPAKFVLASALVSYPGETLPDFIPILLQDADIPLPEALRARIVERIAPDRMADLQSEYISLFDIGSQANPLCETEYDRRRAMGKGAALVDIAGFYRAFGFELDQAGGGREMLDHIGIELEFLALMIMKEIHLSETGDAVGEEIVSFAREKFLLEHLGRFAGAIGKRPGVAANDFYSEVFRWVAGIVDGECSVLGLNVEPADWLDAPSAGEEPLECGALGGCKPAASPT